MMKSNLQPWKRLSSALLLAALCTLPWRACADWVAYNDTHFQPIPLGTSPNATGWNPLPPGSGGALKDIVTGLPVGTATLTVSPCDFAAGSSAGVEPAAGTPAYVTFHNHVGFACTTNNYHLVTPGTTVTYTFSGLDPNQRYSLKATGVRGVDGGTYPLAWVQCEIKGADSFVNAHTAGCLTNGTPNATLTDSQVALCTGTNHTAMSGDVVGWEEIDPGADGTFSVDVIQYVGLLPGGTQVVRTYTYGLGGIRLEEDPLPGPLAIDQQPQDVTLGLDGTATFQVHLSSGTAPQYQWYMQGVGAIAGASFPSFAIPSAGPAANGTYYVIITNSAGDTVTSSSATLTVTGAPIVIVSQPVSQTVEIGDSVALSIEVTGALPLYQWFKDGTAIPKATNPTLVFANVQTTNQANYYVQVTNILGDVQTSSTATLTVLPHTRPPALLSASVLDQGQTNFISVLFSETLSNATVKASNFTVTAVSSGANVGISAAGPSGSSVILVVTGANWVVGGSYILTVSKVSGIYGNTVTPGSQVAIAFYSTMFQKNQTWKYLEDGTDQGVAWRDRTFDDSSWPSGPAAFYLGTIGGCATANTLLTGPPQTMYFRTHFTSPATTGQADLSLGTMVDDGAVFYLNGVQILSTNMPASVSYLSAATTAVGVPTCVTNTVHVTNMLAGDNVLAAEVHQASANGGDAAFAASLRAAISGLTGPGRPRVTIAHQGGNLLLSWTGSGFALDYKTTLSAPAWTLLVSNVNSQVISPTGPAKFFRLRQ